MNTLYKERIKFENNKKLKLCIKNIGISFGGIQALKNIDLEVYDKEILGIVGPNGAGKTTFFNILTGLYTPDNGHIHLDEQDITTSNVIQIVNKGIIRTFQNIRQFNTMTVLENILSAFHHKINYTAFSAIFNRKSYLKEEGFYQEKVYELLEMFQMKKHAHKLAKNLSYGQRKKLEIIRALAFNPKILLLDEPAAGLNSKETQELQKLLNKAHQKFNLTLILIEHDMSFIRSLCNRLYVFNNGSVMSSGIPQDVLAKEEVIKAYLG